MSVVCDILFEDSRWGERVDAEKLVHEVVAKVIEVTRRDVHPDAEASFIFANDERIKSLNAQWRNKDAPTNVLSFPTSVGSELHKAPLLGDVILAYETIERESIDEEKPFAHHAAHMMVHGFLHLVGFDHQNDTEAAAMELIESEVLLKLGLPDPWADDRLTEEV